MKKRRTVDVVPMHICGESAVLPAGSDSDDLSAVEWTKYDSFPETTRAPESVQPVAPASSPPFVPNVYRHARVRALCSGGERIPARAEQQLRDRLTTVRTLRRLPLLVAEALDELRRCSGTDFDGRVVEALVSAVVGADS
jgi:hypothetical protein